MTNSLTTVWLSDYDFGVSICDLDMKILHLENALNHSLNEKSHQLWERLAWQETKNKLAHLEIAMTRLMEALKVEEGSLIQLDGQIVLALKEGWFYDGLVYDVSQPYELCQRCEEAAKTVV